MRAPRWEDIISETFDAKMEDVHTAEPGWVLSYDAGSKTCTAQPAMAQAYVDERGERKLAAKPPCRAARVAFPGNVAFQLEPGDHVLLVYCSTALDNYSPGRNRVADPGDDRRHHLSDPFVVPLGKTNEVPNKGEYIVEYDKVKLGKPGIGSRSPVVRRTDVTAGHAVAAGALASAQASLTAAILAADAPAIAIYTQQVAVLTPLVNSFQAMLDIMSDKVTAT